MPSRNRANAWPQAASFDAADARVVDAGAPARQIEVGPPRQRHGRFAAERRELLERVHADEDRVDRHRRSSPSRASCWPTAISLSGSSCRMSCPARAEARRPSARCRRSRRCPSSRDDGHREQRHERRRRGGPGWPVLVHWAWSPTSHCDARCRAARPTPSDEDRRVGQQADDEERLARRSRRSTRDAPARGPVRAASTTSCSSGRVAGTRTTADQPPSRGSSVHAGAPQRAGAARR